MKNYIPIIAEAHTPPYKIHKYFARRPWNVFKQLIECYSKEGDIVLDPFCGGGVTIYEGVKLGRKMIGLDLNPLSIFIVRNMVKKDVNLLELEKAYERVVDYLNYLYGDYNQITHATSRTKEKGNLSVEWNELAFNAYCNLCGTKILLSNDNRVSNGRYYCLNPDCEGSKNKKGFVEAKNCKRDGYMYLYSVANFPANNKSVIVPFDRQALNKLKQHISFLEVEAKRNKIKIGDDEIPLNWDRQHEDLLHRKGIQKFQDFFTKRNLLINTLLLNFICNLKMERDYYEILRLVFSSSLKDTNIMAFTNDSWQSGKPTTWSKHAYWIPSQFCEVNILESFKKAFNRIKIALLFNKEFSYQLKQVPKFSNLRKDGNLLLKNLSIEKLNIPDNSVNAIITDPPYGSNVQYLELSHFWYIWNKDLYDNIEPDFKNEAISNRKRNFTGAKDMKDYEDNLFKVFEKCYRALKPNGFMVLTFNNKNIAAWLAVLISIFKAGFVFEKDGLVFQDGIDNYKQTAHTKYEGAPYGDFIYVFKKSQIKPKVTMDLCEEDFIKEIDASFNHFMRDFKQSSTHRNNIIRDMFLDALPKIEEYVKTQLVKENKHNLYSHFNKNYLAKIYQ